MSNLICKLIGHRLTVQWNMEKLVGQYCNRCGTWTSRAKSTKGIGDENE